MRNWEIECARSVGLNISPLTLGGEGGKGVKGPANTWLVDWTDLPERTSGCRKHLLDFSNPVERMLWIRAGKEPIVSSK